MKYHITVRDGHHMGDTLCFLNACRKFAHKNNTLVLVSEGAEIVEAYKDDLLKCGDDGLEFPISLIQFRTRPLNVEQGLYNNWLGQYMAAMGIFEPYPVLEMPVFDKGPSYAVIQPFSIWAQNPPLEYIQGVVDAFIEKTGMELFSIGKPDTPQNLQGVNYSLLKDDVVHLLKIVQDAVFVLTPRSLTAHAASGYNRPTFVWCADDGLNWHLDYPGWNHLRVLWKDGLEIAKSALVPLIERHGIAKKQ